jgi:hypothetical protein
LIRMASPRLSRPMPIRWKRASWRRFKSR